MKKINIIWLGSLLFIPLYSMDKNIQIPAGSPVTIAIHNNNHNTLTTAQHQQADQVQEAVQKVNQITKSVHKSLPTLLSSISMPPSWDHEQTKHMLQHYKWWFLCAFCAGIYGTLVYVSIKGNYYLSNQHKWANWRAHIPLAELVGIPHEELTHQLLFDINRQTHSENLGNISAVALDFLHTIKQEEKNLKWYEWWYWLLTRLHILRICCVNKQAYQDIPNKYARLNYLNNLFHSWLLQHQFDIKIPKNIRKKSPRAFFGNRFSLITLFKKFL